TCCSYSCGADPTTAGERRVWGVDSADGFDVGDSAPGSSTQRTTWTVAISRSGTSTFRRARCRVRGRTSQDRLQVGQVPDGPRPRWLRRPMAPSPQRDATRVSRPGTSAGGPASPVEAKWIGSGHYASYCQLDRLRRAGRWLLRIMRLAG